MEGLKEKIIDLWISQRNVDKLREKLEEEKGRLKDVVESMASEDLTYLLDSFYEREMRELETEIPDCIVYAIHELADREDKALNNEEVPF